MTISRRGQIAPLTDPVGSAVREGVNLARGDRGVVVAGVDGSASGQAALEVAAGVARVRGGWLLGVHVLVGLSAVASMAPLTFGYLPQLQAELETEAFLDTASAASAAGVPFGFAVEEGEVSAALRRRAGVVDACLVVVGVDGRHHFWHACPARRLAARTDLPVLLVRR